MESARVPFNPVVLMPSYNNAGTLEEVLRGVAQLRLPMIVVNDGSTDATADVLRRFAADHPQVNVHVFIHRRNRGKAAALRSGLAAAARCGHTHVLTLDTDAQHDPRFIPALLEAARARPEAYVLGVRDDHHCDYPSASRLGRRLSNLLIRFESGLKVADSQCGMRVYPLELIQTVPCSAGRFAYEAEIITRAGWAGCPVVEVPVNTTYLPPGRRVSHYRPWLDTLHGIATHTRLVLRAIAPIPHRRYRPGGVLLRRWLSPAEFLSWLNPLRAWRELRGGGLDRNELAAALAVGVFVANLPAYPFQTLLSLYLARRLHLNPLAVIAGSQLSIPPLGAVLIAGAVCVGHLILHGALPAWPDVHSLHAAWWTWARPWLIDWAVGGPVLGIVLGGITFALAVLLRKPRLTAASPRDCGQERTGQRSVPRGIPAPLER